MPLVRYNATRSLTLGVAVGQQLVQAIPARYAGQIRQRSVVSNTRVSMSGRREHYFERGEDAWSISTKPLTETEAAELVMFLDSVEQGETFEFEPDVRLGRNLLINPGFETGNITGWSAFPGVGAFTVNSNPGLQVAGSYAGQATIAIHTSSSVIASQAALAGVNVAPISPGQVALFQGFAQRDESSLPNRNLILRSFFEDNAGSTLATAVLATASLSTVGYQFLNGVQTAVASSTRARLLWSKDAPHNTDEAGRWLLDEHRLQILSGVPSWRTCELAQFGYSEPRDLALDSLISYQLSIVEVP